MTLVTTDTNANTWRRSLWTSHTVASPAFTSPASPVSASASSPVSALPSRVWLLQDHYAAVEPLAALHSVILTTSHLHRCITQPSSHGCDPFFESLLFRSAAARRCQIVLQKKNAVVMRLFAVLRNSQRQLHCYISLRLRLACITILRLVWPSNTSMRVCLCNRYVV